MVNSGTLISYRSDVRRVKCATTESVAATGSVQVNQPSTLTARSRLDGAVEGLAGQRGRFVIFDEAGGGRGVRGEVGLSTGHAGGALQAVGDIGRAGEADEQAAAAVSLDGEVNVPVQIHAVVDERAVEVGRASVEEENLPVV